MAERLPFEYAEWCSGPVVDLDLLPTGFPICTVPPFTQPTSIGKCEPGISIPDVLIPPFCPCIPTMFESISSEFNIHNATFTGGVTVLIPPKFKLIVEPVTEDCCDPEFEVDYEIDIPCMPFTLKTELRLTGGLNGTIAWKKDNLACDYILDIDLDSGGGICLGPTENKVKIHYEMECEPDDIEIWQTELHMETDAHGETCLWTYNTVEFSIPLLARLSNTGDPEITKERNIIIAP